MLGYTLLLAILIIICALGLGSGIYIIYSIIKDKPLVHPPSNSFIATYLGRGRLLKVKLFIIGISMSLGWLFVLWGLLFAK
jgi:hypothetical protein